MTKSVTAAICDGREARAGAAETIAVPGRCPGRCLPGQRPPRTFSHNPPPRSVPGSGRGAPGRGRGRGGSGAGQPASPDPRGPRRALGQTAVEAGGGSCSRRRFPVLAVMSGGCRLGSQSPGDAPSVTRCGTNGIDREFSQGSSSFSCLRLLLESRSLVVSLARAPRTSRCSLAGPCSAAAPRCPGTVTAASPRSAQAGRGQESPGRALSEEERAGAESAGCPELRRGGRRRLG